MRLRFAASEKPGLVILADDLTGALDAAAPFAARGLGAAVAVSVAAAREALAAGTPVVAINTASREIAAAAARARVAETLALLPAGVRVLKKVDSRLKGHVEAELEPFAAGRIAVLPAIPEFGRIVENGHLTGFGVDAPIPVAERLGALAGRAVVPDTRSAAALRAALAALPEDALLVGARGLAEALAEGASETVPRLLRGLGRSLSLVIGSRDPITLTQVEGLGRRFSDLLVLEAPDGVLDRPVAGGAVPALTLLQAVPGARASSEHAVARALADSLQAAALKGRDGLLISGGATAETVLEALGVTVLAVLGEILPGLPVSKAGDRLIVTKSGGFGAPDALAAVAAAYLMAPGA